VVAVLSRYIVGRGRPGTGTLILVTGLTVNIVANLILVPRFGINGAAASSSISYGLTAIVTLVVFQRLSGRSIVETLVSRPSDLRAARGLLEAVVRRLRGGRGEDSEVPGSETAAEIVLAEREPGEEAERWGSASSSSTTTRTSAGTGGSIPSTPRSIGSW